MNTNLLIIKFILRLLEKCEILDGYLLHISWKFAVTIFFSFKIIYTVDSSTFSIFINHCQVFFFLFSLRSRHFAGAFLFSVWRKGWVYLNFSPILLNSSWFLSSISRLLNFSRRVVYALRADDSTRSGWRSLRMIAQIYRETTRSIWTRKLDAVSRDRNFSLEQHSLQRLCKTFNMTNYCFSYSSRRIVNIRFIIKKSFKNYL